MSIVTLHSSRDFADPAPPFVDDSGAVEIFGSASFSLQFSSWQKLLRGEAPQERALSLRHPDGRQVVGPWDVRKYRVHEEGKKAIEEVILAGVMTSPPSGKLPRWPFHNKRRRIFLFRKGKRTMRPLIGELESGWIDHSYGGNYFHFGMPSPSELRLRQKSELFLFFEKVSELCAKGRPYKTEIYCAIMRNLETPLGTPQKILEIGEPPLLGSERVLGGYLLEGLRPLEISVDNQRFVLGAFSAGDFCTDAYGVHFAYAVHPLGPWKIVRNSRTNALQHHLLELKNKWHLSWMGRPALFKDPHSQNLRLLFHAVRKSDFPRHNYSRWPRHLRKFRRFLVSIQMSVTLNQGKELQFHFEEEKSEQKKYES